MSSKTQTVILRLVRTATAAALGACAGFVVGPDFSGLVGTKWAVLIGGFLTPLIAAAEKWLRYGQDSGEGTGVSGG